MLTCQRSGDVIAVEGQLQVQFLESLKDFLLPELGSSHPLVLDLSRVSEVDLAGLQFLLAFATSRQRIGAVRFANPPALLNKALELSGLRGAMAPFWG